MMPGARTLMALVLLCVSDLSLRAVRWLLAGEAAG